MKLKYIFHKIHKILKINRKGAFSSTLHHSYKWYFFLLLNVRFLMKTVYVAFFYYTYCIFLLITFINQRYLSVLTKWDVVSRSLYYYVLINFSFRLIYIHMYIFIYVHYCSVSKGTVLIYYILWRGGGLILGSRWGSFLEGSSCYVIHGSEGYGRTLIAFEFCASTYIHTYLGMRIYSIQSNWNTYP